MTPGSGQNGAVARDDAAVMELRSELASGMREIAAFALDEAKVSVCAGRDAIWAIIRNAGAGLDAQGGLAVRAAHCPSGPTRVRHLRRQPGDVLKIEVATAIGPQAISFSQADAGLSTLRIRTELTPSAPLAVPLLPRDLYPLGADDDPLLARGQIMAIQRGLASGSLYFQLEEPAVGTALYFQNFTTLGDYFVATDTTPDSVVGGVWPELGYLPPAPPPERTPPNHALPAWKTLTMVDTILVFDHATARVEHDAALQSLQLLGAAYRLIERPPTQYHDWVARAGRTRHDRPAPEMVAGANPVGDGPTPAMDAMPGQPGASATTDAQGASACMRMWQMTDDREYLHQSHAYLASFFQGCAIWQSPLGATGFRGEFMSISGFEDRPDLALAATGDSFAAFARFIAASGPDLDPAVRMLVCEYCKYAMDRAWFGYPDAPSEAQPTPGESAGTEAASIFAKLAFHDIDGAPFRIFCDHFVKQVERSPQSISLQFSGTDQFVAVLDVIRLERKTLPRLVITTSDGIVRARQRSADRVEYALPANALVSLNWG